MTQHYITTTRFDENSDLTTTYLGKSDRSKNDKLKAEESFPISEQGYMLGKLLDGSECQLLLETGASKSFMSKSFYMPCKSLHSLPKFASKTQRIQVENGQFVSVLFIIKVIPSCQNLSTCLVSHFILCQNLHQKHREFR